MNDTNASDTHSRIRPALRSLVPLILLLTYLATCEKSDTPPPVPVAAPVETDVSPQAAKALLDSDAGYIYLDVRTIEEFEAGHVPGAINIPYLLFTDSGGAVPNADFLATTEAALPKNAKIIVGCRTGARSKRAQAAMVQSGYEHVSSMLGGFAGKKTPPGDVVHPGWSSLDYPRATGAGGENSYTALRAKVQP